MRSQRAALDTHGCAPHIRCRVDRVHAGRPDRHDRRGALPDRAVLGAGAMGCVYRARHDKVGREVAIKVLRDDLVREPAMVERFEREARIAARLRHPNLVGVLDVGRRRAAAAHGHGARARAGARPTSSGAPMPRARVIALRRPAAARPRARARRGPRPPRPQAGEHARRAPRRRREIARIVDFGIAVLRDRDATRPSALASPTPACVVGTPMYMAPEQATARPSITAPTCSRSA